MFRWSIVASGIDMMTGIGDPEDQPLDEYDMVTVV